MLRKVSPLPATIQAVGYSVSIHISVARMASQQQSGQATRLEAARSSPELFPDRNERLRSIRRPR